MPTYVYEYVLPDGKAGKQFEWRQAMSELGDADRKALQPLGKIMGRGLALKGRVHCQDDLVDPAGSDPRNEPVDREILRPDTLEGREPPSQNMESARKEPRAIE